MSKGSRTPARRRLFFFAAVLLILVCATSRGSLLMLRAIVATLRNQPSKLVINSERHDFGEIARGTSAEAHFWVTNAGGRRLILEREGSGCPCLASESQMQIPPGKSCELTATLHTEQVEGEMHSHIRYSTNDPSCPILDLTLLAQVSPQR